MENVILLFIIMTLPPPDIYLDVQNGDRSSMD